MKTPTLACAVLAVTAACAPAARPAHLATVPRQEAAGAPPPATSGAPPQPRHQGGVDTSTGQYGREDDDLVVNTTMPLVLRRTYHSGDGNSRPFGVGWTHPGEWLLYGDGDPRVPWIDLILANGTRVHFVRISPGETQQGALLRHDSSPTEFTGALLAWTGSLWEMRLRDGSVATFTDCDAENTLCSLVERRDAEGHRVAYVRDTGGRLLKMESEGQSIVFEYDDQRRVTRAYDTQRNEVRYRYDEGGRLVRATWSDGTVRDYSYDDQRHLTGIREPGRIIQNWFDESGRMIRQVVRHGEDEPDAYVATLQYVVENGLVVESNFDEGSGLLATQYDEHHYAVSDALDADGPAPVVFAYERDAVSHELIGATMSCVGETARVTRLVPLAAQQDDGLKASLIRAFCVRP